MDIHHITVPARLRGPLLRSLAEYKVTFLSAGAGWGKTSVVRELLKTANACFLQAQRGRTPRFSLREPLVALDGVQDLDARAEERLAAVLRRAPSRQHFLLLSRGPVPDWLLGYQFDGALRLFQAEDLALRTEDIAKLAGAWGLELPAEEVRELGCKSCGYPPLVRFLLEARRDGVPAGQRAWECAKRRLWDYLDAALYRGWDAGTRRLVLCGACFGPFPASLAPSLFGEAGDGALQAARSSGVFARGPEGWWQLSDRFILEEYLRQRARRDLPAAQLRQLHLSGGAWCAGQGNYAGAVGHFEAAGSRAGVLDTLIRAVREDPDAWQLCRLHGSYEGLSPEEAAAAPELLYALCRLEGLKLEPERSEAWYRALRAQADGPDPVPARSWLFYLDLNLPQRRGGLSRPCLEAKRRLEEGAFQARPVSLTCGLPSILRGERDLSGALEGDPGLSAPEVQRAVEAVLGRHGAGLGLLLQAERRLERGEDAADLLLQWHPLQRTLRERGALDNEFVCAALMARFLSAEGQLSQAEDCLLRFRQRAQAQGAAHLLANLDAARCRLSLLEDGPYAAGWFASQPPDGGTFFLPDSYRLLTKARCHIKREEYHAALFLLGQLLECWGRVPRPLDRMETLALIAMCRFRMGGGDWRKYLSGVLALGERYGYVTVLAQEGAALLPLLEGLGPGAAPPGYWDKLLRRTVAQAGRYPLYLKPLHGLKQPLTPAEAIVLKLVLQYKPAGEIARLLNIKPATVRTHLRNLFDKLDVHSQEEARLAAVRLRLDQSSGSFYSNRQNC